MAQKNKKRVTLKDIAEKSGYTINTVSHALRGKSDISLTTKKKIKGIAEELGYVGNTLASSLRSGRSNTVAVIVSDVVNPHFAYVVHNIESCVRKAGYSTIVLCTGDVIEQEVGAIRTALSHLADGVLICPSQVTFEPIELLKSSGIPFVIMGREFPGEPGNQVLCDDEGGARLLTESLIRRGHRRILYVGGERQFSSERERRSGYMEAMKGAGLAGDIMTCGFEAYAELEAMGQLNRLVATYNPTAIFAFRDAMAWAIINEVRKAGIRVPEDLSVAGFDYTAEHLKFIPPLTTVAAEADNYSTVAAERLIELMRAGDQPPRTVRLPMRLIDPDATVQDITG